MRMVTVTGQIISKNGITLFFADGASEVLSTESFKTQAILKAIMPDMMEKGSAEVDLDGFAVNLEKQGVTLEATSEGVDIVTANGRLKNGADALEKHLMHAETTGDARGLKAFIADLQPVITKRRHSVDDLLTFMKKADLPIADDGSIIVYKILRSQHRYDRQKEELKGWWVDCHTGQVPQRLGSTVQVKDETMVDPNRAQECSNGLHVCQIGYVSGFGGDIICLAKVRPSDVIAVPSHDINKMRVSRYTLVAEFPTELHSIVRSGRSAVSDEKLRAFVEKVMSGDHAAVNSIITINGQHGQNCTTELIDAPSIPDASITPDTPTVTAKMKAKREKDAKPKDRQLEKFNSKPKAVHVKDIKAEVAVRRSKLTPSEIKARDYAKKLAKAQRLLEKGYSIRQISEKLGMDRKALSKNLIAA